MGIVTGVEQGAEVLDDTQAAALVRAPTENLSLELKTWLDLDQPEHKAKLVRALLAMRNHNGGYILIGFDDETGEPAATPSHDPRVTYHADILQGLVSAYAAYPFGIEVRYPERGGVARPVIEVPTGVQVPVAVKKALVRDGSKLLLRKGDVMFRTLAANNVVSSSAAEPSDWPSIMDICFANREADLAGFVRRHLLSGELPVVLAELGAFASRPRPPSLEETCRDFAARCELRAEEKERARGLPPLPDSFGWMEVTSVLDPPASGNTADKNFLNRLMISKPTFDNGLWLDTRGFSDAVDRPMPDLDGWETLVDFPGDWMLREFARLEQAGRFYIRRPLPEDSTSIQRGARAGAILGIELTIAHVTEAMAVVLAFAQALVTERRDERIGLLFRYKGLKGRRLVSLAGVAAQLIAFENKSAQDDYDSFVEVPVTTVALNLGPFVAQVTRPLFALFDGYAMTVHEIERRIQAYVKRRPM